MGERSAMIEKDIELGLAQGPQYFQEVCEFGVLLSNTAKMVQKLKVKLIPTGQVCFPVCSFPSSLSKKESISFHCGTQLNSFSTCTT
jgi:hypothetical protein